MRSAGMILIAAIFLLLCLVGIFAIFIMIVPVAFMALAMQSPSAVVFLVVLGALSLSALALLNKVAWPFAKRSFWPDDL